MEGTGFLGQAAENVYHLEKDDHYLVGTSEVPLAAYHMDEIIDADQLPLRYAGFSPCYRREAGTYGKDTRGIFRVHQFDKVEMFSYTTPEDAEAEHQRLLDWEKQWLTALGLPFQVIDVATGDLGASASRKFDCEAWIPTQGKYRELTSTSNCTEFQARRLSRPDARRQAGPPAGHAQRHAVRGAPHHRRDPGEPPAGRRLGARARGAAAVPGRPGGPGAGRQVQSGHPALGREPGDRPGAGAAPVPAGRHRPRRHAAALRRHGLAAPRDALAAVDRGGRARTSSSPAARCPGPGTCWTTSATGPRGVRAGRARCTTPARTGC